MKEKQKRLDNEQVTSTDGKSFEPATKPKPFKKSKKRIFATTVLAIVVAFTLWMIWVWYALGNDSATSASLFPGVF